MVLYSVITRAKLRKNALLRRERSFFFLAVVYAKLSREIKDCLRSNVKESILYPHRDRIFFSVLKFGPQRLHIPTMETRFPLAFSMRSRSDMATASNSGKRHERKILIQKKSADLNRRK